jgi:hypothetical protein
MIIESLNVAWSLGEFDGRDSMPHNGYDGQKWNVIDYQFITCEIGKRHRDNICALM